MLMDLQRSCLRDRRITIMGWQVGDLFIYQNGDRYEIGKVKRVCDDGVFAYYSCGGTSAKTPFDCMHKLVNGYCIKDTVLGIGDD